MMEPVRWLLMAFALVLGGCATAPWTRLAITGGASFQRFSTNDPALGEGTVDGAYVFRSEIDFLQLLDPADRNFDLGVGYGFFDLPSGQRVREARSSVMAAGRYHLFWEEYEDGSILRLSLGGNADLLLYANGFGGAGGSVTLDFEVATRTSFWSGGGGGASEDGVFLGGGAVAPGEAGIGVRAETSYHVLEDGTHRWMLTLGFIARVPAFAFAGVIIPSLD
jgi:hypothetical protein